MSRLSPVGRAAVVALVVAVSSLAACSDGEGSAPPVDGRSFESTTVEGRDLVEGTTIQMTFADGRVAVVAGCNGMSGDVGADGDAITLDGLMSTSVGCDRAREEQDLWLLSWLDAGAAGTVDGDVLTFTGDGITVTFEALPEPDPAPTVDGTWTLESIVDGDTVGSGPVAAERPTLEIDGDEATLGDGCNDVTVSFSYDPEAATATFGDGDFTEVTCDGEQAALEAEVRPRIDAMLGATVSADLVPLGTVPTDVCDGCAPSYASTSRLTLTIDGRGLDYQRDS